VFSCTFYSKWGGPTVKFPHWCKAFDHQAYDPAKDRSRDQATPAATDD